MSESLLSGRFGEPEGSRLLSQKEKAALENLVRNEVILNQIIINEQTGSSNATEDWGTFDENGVEVVQTSRNTLTCEHLSIGTYKVTRNTAFPAGPAAAPLVTPMSIATVDTTLTVQNQLWFTDDTPTPVNDSVWYDPVTNNVWATDFDHDTTFTSPDRLAIGQPTSVLPEVYWSLPSSHPWLNQFKGTALLLDLTYRLAMVQATPNDGSGLQITTLFVDMDTLAVLDHQHAHSGGSFAAVVVGFSDDHLLVYHSGVGIELWTRDGNGLPATKLGTYSGAGGTGAIGHQHAVVDNNGNFWAVNSASPAEWESYDVSASFPQAASRHAIPGGTAGVLQNGMHDFNPDENAIYFLSDQSGPHLMKISCDSPFTYTTITGSQYANSYDVDTADETVKDSIVFRWNADYSRLILIRGGDDYPYFFLVDPSDGSIDVALTLPVTFSSNYEVRDVAMFGGQYIATRGNQYLQVINYVIAGEGSDLTFTPPLIGARMLDTSNAIVEFWNPEALPNKVKMDCGFHIGFARD